MEVAWGYYRPCHTQVEIEGNAWLSLVWWFCPKPIKESFPI
jgi:hypothetical protein